MKPTLIAVSGSRDFALADAPDIHRLLWIALKDHAPAVLAVGDCKTGVDAIVTEFATNANIHCTVHEADWSKGRAAGPIRNRRLVTGADLLVAFKRKGSANRGTSSAINEATKAKVPVTVHTL